MDYQNLINGIETREGFEGMPYNDTRGFPTIGFGTLLPISEDEGRMLLEHRLKNSMQELLNEKPFVTNLPEEIQEVLAEMAYQLGVPKLMLFKKMWKAVEDEDWNGMIREMYDSLWYKQTPDRVKALVVKVKQAKEAEA